MGKIFYLMGKSSSGKDTIFKELLEKDELGLKTVVLYTTRPIREGEKDGVEYFFVSEEELHRLQEENKVIELRSYDTVHGIWNYFTVNDEQIDLEKHDYLVMGTLVSFDKLKAYFGEEVMVPIYVEVEDGLRLTRALEREKRQDVPKYAEMCRRFLADTEDFSEENIKKSGIEKRFQNVELNTCLDEIVEYMDKFYYNSKK